MRLSDSYGNARHLLQNKLGELDKLCGLWTCKGEEHIARVLASLVNAMKDLCALASKHEIEGKLYEGGGFEKGINLIGDARHKILSLNLATTSKKIEWEKLVILNDKFQVIERMALGSKTANLMGNERKNTARIPNPKICVKVFIM